MDNSTAHSGFPGQVMMEIEIVFDPEHHAESRCGYCWTAHYSHRPQDFGRGTTPYMAVLDLINNYNTTDAEHALTQRRAQEASLS